MVYRVRVRGETPALARSTPLVEELLREDGHPAQPPGSNRRRIVPFKQLRGASKPDGGVLLTDAELEERVHRAPAGEIPVTCVPLDTNVTQDSLFIDLLVETFSNSLFWTEFDMSSDADFLTSSDLPSGWVWMRLGRPLTSTRAIRSPAGFRAICPFSFLPMAAVDAEQGRIVAP